MLKSLNSFSFSHRFLCFLSDQGVFFIDSEKGMWGPRYEPDGTEYDPNHPRYWPERHWHKYACSKQHMKEWKIRRDARPGDYQWNYTDTLLYRQKQVVAVYQWSSWMDGSETGENWNSIVSRKRMSLFGVVLFWRFIAVQDMDLMWIFHLTMTCLNAFHCCHHMSGSIFIGNCRTVFLSLHAFYQLFCTMPLWFVMYNNFHSVS
jgi:hypothetical protein